MADALALGASVHDVGVQVLPKKNKKENRIVLLVHLQGFEPYVACDVSPHD